MTKPSTHAPPALMIDDPNETSYVRELLRAGREAGAADYDIDKGLSKHLGLIATGAPVPDWAQTLAPTHTGATAGAALVGSGIAAWLVVPVVGAVAVAALLWAVHGEPSPVRPQVSVATPSPLPAAARERVPQAVTVAPEAETKPAAVSAEAGRRAPAQRAKHGAAVSMARRSETLLRPSPTHAPATTAAPIPRGALPSNGQISGQSPAPFETAKAAQISVQQPEVATPVAATPAKSAPRTPPDDAALEREMGMLSVAQRVLHTDAARTLELTRQGEAEFPGSMFTQERQQLLLLALIKLGRVEEAKTLARPYLARYPHGPFSDRVRHSLLSGRVER